MTKNPHQLAQERLELSEQYSKYSGELAKLIKSEAMYYNLNREKYKSDTAVKRAYEVTDDGVNTTIIKLKLKSLEKSMSAIKTLLEVANTEAFGVY